jgi:putative transcriptional regulator
LPADVRTFILRVMDIRTDLRGSFLIATPTLTERTFRRSVILLCEHAEGGSLGVIVNKPLDLTVDKLLGYLELGPVPSSRGQQAVFFGGPVRPEGGLVLHSPPARWGSTIQVTPELCICYTRDILEAIARGEGPERYLVALGYAGWGPRQLEHELTENAWLLAPSRADLVFEAPVEERWRTAASLLGIEPGQLSDHVGHA